MFIFQRMATVKNLIKDLGGPTAVARRLDITTAWIHNWQRSNMIPPVWYLVFVELASSAGLDADRVTAEGGLFGFADPTPFKLQQSGEGSEASPELTDGETVA